MMQRNFSNFPKPWTPPLNFAEDEANDVASFYGNAAKAYTRLNATKSRFIAEAPGYGQVLVATHGLLDDDQPTASALVFAQQGQEKGYALLNAGEIFNIPLSANLIALSACDLGGGTIRDGEGILGFTRALIYSGSANIVLSLWLASIGPPPPLSKACSGASEPARRTRRL
jgi:CHAT domain-containing protein